MTSGGAPRHGFVQANGLRMHYQEWGGDGPVVLFAHALSFCANVWAPLATALASHYRVLSVDLRGHGDTDLAPDGDYSWRVIGRDMAAFLMALDIRDALAIGHSYGGAALLIGGALAPGHLRCAIHMEPAPVLTLGEHVRAQWVARGAASGSGPRRRRVVWDSRQQILEAYRHKANLRTWREEFIRAFIDGSFRDRADGRMELKVPPEVDDQQRRMARPYPGMWEELAAYDTPTLIVMGRESPVAPPDSPEVRRWLEVTRNTRFLWVPGTGHYFPMERPQEFEDIIRRFVREVGEDGGKQEEIP